MPEKKQSEYPKTQHSSVFNQGEPFDNAFIALDSPDDRITEQFGNGTTLVKNDNPDDLEFKYPPEA